MQPHRESPGRETEALTDPTPIKSFTSIDPRDGIARHVGGTFVVVVEATGGKYRRRCYLTVKAAEDAARRATDRGETATVYLAELKPLWKVRGGERA